MPKASGEKTNSAHAKKSSRPVKDNAVAKIKYADKSAGQPQLVPVFNAIRDILAPYEKGTMMLAGGEKGKAILVSKKPVEILGKRRDELWFAAALVQKGYVGFYFTPASDEELVRKQIHPDLLKLLKGKSCFHVKKFNAEMMAHIKAAVKIGHEAWRKRGWI